PARACTHCPLLLLQFLSLVGSFRQVRGLLLRPGLALSLPPVRVVACLTRLFSGTTALVTPLCFGSEAWPLAFLCLAFPGLSLPFLRALALPVSPVSRGASVLPLTPPNFLRQRLRCRRCTWTCGAPPASVDSVTSATSCWWLTTTR
ncbi:unnamed protein product, partial [Closterium sp. NIES-53]